MYLTPESTATKLKSLGFSKEADYFNSLVLSKEMNPSQQIPTFYNFHENCQNSFAKLFKKASKLRYKRMISNLILEEEDFINLESALGLPTRKIVPFSSINWKEVDSLISFCDGFYLNENLLSNFKKGSAFNSLDYINFLKYLSFIFETYERIDDLDLNSVVSESDISNFINVIIHDIPSLKNLGNYIDYYTTYATAVMMFFLTSFEGSKVFTRRFLSSRILLQLINLRFENNPDNLKRNPFRKDASSLAYNTFVRLDSEQSGYLLPTDVKEFNRFSFTDAFLSRLFNNVLTTELNDGRLDYTLFLSFYLATTFLKSPRSVDLFFQVADIDGDGLISNFDILYFYKAMKKECKINNHSYETFLSELLDNTKGKPEGITKEQIYKTRSSDPFFLLLFDKNTFKKWEETSEEEIVEGM